MEVTFIWSRFFACLSSTEADAAKRGMQIVIPEGALLSR